VRTLVVRHKSKEARKNECAYHMRLPVIIPTFSIVSHICASVNTETWVNNSRSLRVHHTTRMNSMNHLWCCNGTLVH